MAEFREPVFYVPGTTTIIDDAVDRAGVLVGHYSGETLEQIRLRHPGAALGEWDDVYAETGLCLIKGIMERFMRHTAFLPQKGF